MPNQVFINDITKVILRDGTVIDIAPESFSFQPTQFFVRTPEGNQYANLEYLAYRFVNQATEEVYYMSTDAVLALITIAQEVPTDG